MLKLSIYNLVSFYCVIHIAYDKQDMVVELCSIVETFLRIHWRPIRRFYKFIIVQQYRILSSSTMYSRSLPLRFH